MSIPTPVLEGFGVRLEPLSMDHLGSLFATQDAATWKFMSESGASLDLMRGFVQRALSATAAGNCQAWASTIRHPDGMNEVVGCSRIADLNPQHRTGEIGWTWIAPALRGSGWNAKVKLLQLRHAFETLRLRRVALKTHHANAASQKAILKLGAKYEGTFRNHLIMPDGSSRDTLWYSMIDSEWPDVQQMLLQRIESTPPRLSTGPAAKPNVE